MPSININSVRPPSSSIRLVLAKGATSTRGLFVTDANSGNDGGSHKNAANKPGGRNNAGPNILGLDTVPTFTGAFASPALSIDFFQNDGFTTVSPYIMIGGQPQLGGATTIPAKMTAVSLQLLKADGSVFANVPFGPFEDLTEDSPNFRNATTPWVTRSSGMPYSAPNSST